MKDYWFRYIEQKDREAQYFQTLSLSIAGDVSNVKDGFKKLKDALNAYHGALFPWMPDPYKQELENREGLLKQMEEEVAYLEANHTFEIKRVEGTITMIVPEYMLKGEATAHDLSAR